MILHVCRKKCTKVRLTDQIRMTKLWQRLRVVNCVSPTKPHPPPPWGRREGGGEGYDDKAGEMMGRRCPSPTSEDEQLHPGATDKETCSAEGREGISSFILWLP